MRSYRVLVGLSVLGWVVVAPAQTFNFVSGFGTTSNPAGQFTYGSKANFGTSTFTKYTSSINSGGFKGWGTSSTLGSDSIVKNTSGASNTYQTGVYGVNAVAMFPDSSLSVIRFTAPTAGAYQLTGQFSFRPYTTGGDGVQVNIKAFNPNTTLLNSVLLNSGKAGISKYAFDITTGQLSSGSYIDFMASHGPSNSIGDSVIITGTVTAVPEPATVAMMSVGLLALLRRRKTAKAVA